jgi:hypothetical protein
MVSKKISVLAFALTTMMFMGCDITGAQSISAQSKIRSALELATADSRKAIEINFKTSVLVILLVNSSINGATHQGYSNDAQAAVHAVILAVKDDPEFAKMSSIKVSYIERKASLARDRILDSVEFRKNSSGAFVLHTS